MHSPFVYEFVTKCLYNKKYSKASKSCQVLLKSISYFSIENFKIIAENSEIENLIQKEFGLKARQEGPYDLIYHDYPSVDILSNHLGKMCNDGVILIENIHDNKDTTEIWKALSQNEMITVSIDMFYCGLLCLRKEQAKEHFKIRI